ncbi:uncharacterized protein LOC130636274 [Hydractinia symbiolongicarpus]|uniref:uncharacterized protein LOC130636274 n=1 Tax=Hydractinia symbiolongicarpus TaxID=13093 RepID=UPI00254B1873|nr:uncharacterized protein LOC130636274 [Hydractinia symbiolongicarpus]
MHESAEKKNLQCYGLTNMSGKVLRQEETSSGYSSRESLHEGAKQPAVQDSESSCSCKRSNSSKSTQRYYSPSSLSDLDSIKKKPSSKHSRSGSPSLCCSQNGSLHRVNEQLQLQNRLLEEQNLSLLEELQVSRRFYQGTLADLSSKLSAAENRIKHLKEVVSTQEEAIGARKEDTDVSISSIPSSPNLQLETPVFGRRKQHKTSSVVNFPSSQRNRGSFCDTPQSVVSAAGSIVSECSGRTKRSPLQGKNFARMKEHLLEKNQNLKTDIELLKVKTDVPRSASVPVLWPEKSQELPNIKQSNKPVNAKNCIDEKNPESSYAKQVASESKKKSKSRHKPR